MHACMQLPLTRPKSPKLTRRRSCGDAGRACCEEIGTHERGKERMGGRRSVDTINRKDEDDES